MLRIPHVSNMMADMLIFTQDCTSNSQAINALTRQCEHKYPLACIGLSRSGIKYILLFVLDFNIQ